ncbi:MAG: hypothetical protein KR126chlam5_01201 [Candidatus Anoxychlamydiales bacterium]|nr:hypothetical protein [Candidatus Anoxychlamydiales bacterium]
MGNTQAQSMVLTPSAKQPNYQSGSVSIGEMLKALTKVMMQESILMLTFSKIMDQLNEKMLDYTNDYTSYGLQAAKISKSSNIIEGVSAFVVILPGLSLLKVESPENPNAAGLQKKCNTLNKGAIRTGPYAGAFGLAVYGSLQAYWAINKGELTSGTLKTQTGSEKCKGLIDFLKKHFDSDSSTLNQITTMIKDIIERDYNSKAKKLYFYNKK